MRSRKNARFAWRGGEGMPEINTGALKKRIYLAKLNDKLAAVVAKRGSLIHPEVVALSRKMDRVVVEIMRMENTRRKGGDALCLSNTN